MPLSSARVVRRARSRRRSRRPRSTVRNAIAGVGSTPASSTSPPAPAIPSTSASSSQTPEARGSRPTTTRVDRRRGGRGRATAARPSPRGELARSAPSPATPAHAVGAEEPPHRAAPYPSRRRLSETWRSAATIDVVADRAHRSAGRSCRRVRTGPNPGTASPGRPGRRRRSPSSRPRRRPRRTRRPDASAPPRTGRRRPRPSPRPPPG